MLKQFHKSGLRINTNVNKCGVTFERKKTRKVTYFIIKNENLFFERNKMMSNMDFSKSECLKIDFLSNDLSSVRGDFS